MSLFGAVFHHARDGGELIVVYNVLNPDDGQPYDSTEITSASLRVLDPSTTPSTVLLASTPLVWDSVSLAWKYAWAFGELLDGKRAVVLEVVPTRASGVDASLAPERRVLIQVTDLKKRVDEHHAATAATMAAARASLEGAGFDTNTDSLRALRDENLAENNDTQARIEALDLRQSVHFVVPANLAPPETGQRVYDVFLRIRDDLGTFVDPDGGALPVMSQLGALPAGVTLGGFGYEATGSTGRFRGTVTVEAGAPESSLALRASWTRDGLEREEVRATTISTYEADTATILGNTETLLTRATEARLAKLERDIAERVDVTAARDVIVAEVDGLEEEVGTSVDAADPLGTLHAKVRALQKEESMTVTRSGS